MIRNESKVEGRDFRPFTEVHLSLPLTLRVRHKVNNEVTKNRDVDGGNKDPGTDEVRHKKVPSITSRQITSYRLFSTKYIKRGQNIDKCHPLDQVMVNKVVTVSRTRKYLKYLVCIQLHLQFNDRT